MKKILIISAFQDRDVPDERFSELLLSSWINSKYHTAYNTFEASKLACDMTVDYIN